MTPSMYVIGSSSDKAVSEAAEYLCSIYREIKTHYSQSLSLSRQKRSTEEALIDAVCDAAVDNWDGYGAKRVSGKSYQYAMSFIEVMTPSIPVPDVSVDPDGEVCFIWYSHDRWLFSVSFSGTGRLAYAGLFGRNEIHGNEYYIDRIPDALHTFIKRVSVNSI